MKKEIYRSNWFDLEGYNACTVKYSDGSKKTVLQHRELMEEHLGLLCTGAFLSITKMATRKTTESPTFN